jgi:DNA-directed RNA polymerase I, II, and III subunit RPABC2
MAEFNEIENLSDDEDISSVDSDVPDKKFKFDEGAESDENDEDDEYTEDAEDENIEGIEEMNENLYNEDVAASDSESESDEEYDEDDLQKIDETIHKKIIDNHHPELKSLNYEEIDTLCTVVRNNKGEIIDPLHKTIPILSRYEKARILGERAEQINSGAQPFIDIEPTMIDGYLIALKELEQKKIPFIIQRPLPNGGCEYWRLHDLEII